MYRSILILKIQKINTKNGACILFCTKLNRGKLILERNSSHRSLFLLIECLVEFISLPSDYILFISLKISNQSLNKAK